MTLPRDFVPFEVECDERPNAGRDDERSETPPPSSVLCATVRCPECDFEIERVLVNVAADNV